MEHITQSVVRAEKLALIGLLCVAGGFIFRQWRYIGNWISRLAVIFDARTYQMSAGWLLSMFEGNLTTYAILAGLAAIACVGGLALFLSDGRG